MASPTPAEPPRPPSSSSSAGSGRGPGIAVVAVLAALTALAALPAASATNYSLPKLNDSYVSETHFDDRGMGLLYNLSVDFLRAIQDPDPLPPNLLTVHNGILKVNVDDPGAVVAFYSGVVATVAVGLLVALALPLVACCFGCCRRGKAKKGAPCIAPLVLALLACVALCFAIATLVANSYLSDGVSGLRGRLGAAVSDDVRLFIYNGNEEANTLLETNYAEMSEALDDILESRSAETVSLVQAILTAFPLQLALDAATGMRDVYRDLAAMNTETGEMVTTANSIANGLAAVKTDVEQGCLSAPNYCQAFLDQIVIPDTALIDQAASLIEKSRDAVRFFDNDDFIVALNGVKQTFVDVNNTVDARLGDLRQTVKKAVSDTGGELRDKAGNLTASVNSAAAELNRVDETLSGVDSNIQSFELYRNIVFIVMGVILVAIPVGTIIRLLIVVCTKNRSYGTLHRDVWVISLLMLLLTALTTALFLGGLTSDRACQALREPEGSQIMALVDQMVRLPADLSLPVANIRNVSYYISSCHEDKTMYEILELDSVVNIDEIIENVGKFSLDEYTQQISQIVADQIDKLDLIPQLIEEELQKLVEDTAFDVDTDRIKTEIDNAQRTASEIKLDDWVQTLEAIGSTISHDFTDDIERLTSLKGDVQRFTASCNTVAGSVSSLLDHRRLGQDGTFHETLQKVLEEKARAEAFIKAQAPKMVQLASETATQIHGEVLDFLKSAATRVRREALRCGPLARVYDALLVSTCDRIGAPLNGYWAGAGVCLLLFVPMALLASCLSTRR